MRHIFFNLFFLICLPIAVNVQADVVKPALVEISVEADGRVTLEIRASIEALLTGINARFKNTQDAPQAADYDGLRHLSTEQLQQRFTAFQAHFLAAIRLTADQQPISLHLDDLLIPVPGYTKVPRISRIMLSGILPGSSQVLQWYYPTQFGDNAVRLRQVDTLAGRWRWSDWQWIRQDQLSEPFALQQFTPRRSVGEQLVDYIGTGFTHIVPFGMDHVLFVLGLYLFGSGWRPLLWQVSVFTLAHSLTLGLSLAGLVRLPSAWVEPLIAASIVYIAIENIGWRGVMRWVPKVVSANRVLSLRRLGVVFGFGLLHGLGFAEMLLAFGMPVGAFFTALVGFNLGVECGQVAVIATAFALTGWLRSRANYRYWVVIPGSLCIAVVGLFWTLERLPS